MLQPPMPPPPKKGLSTGCIVALALALLSVPIIGILATLAIYGFRRYLVAAKTAGAKDEVSAIARGAQAAFERDHKLCASRGPDAPGHGPVPADFKSVQGMKYVPSSTAGTDFQTGSDHGGWKCLGFSTATPMYYQVHYNAGAGFVTPHGAAAGPNGFEAAALGDLNNDGVKGMFARIGQVEGGKLVVDTQIWIQNEFE